VTTLDEVFTAGTEIDIGNIRFLAPTVDRERRRVVTAVGRSKELPYEDLWVGVIMGVKKKARLHLVSWTSTESPARLIDDKGRSYTQLPDTENGLTVSTIKEIGPRHQASVDVIADPKDTAVMDGISFERPVLMPEWFILELPCENFGGKGTIRFRLRAP